MLYFYTNKKGAVSSKFLNFFIYTPLFKWDDVGWYFPGLSVFSETTMWHSRQASVNTFPHVSLLTKDDDSAKTWFCFWLTCFWPFRSIATSSYDRIFPGANISWKRVLDKFVSQCCVHRVSLTEPGHLEPCPTFHKSNGTSKALSCLFVSWH